MVGNKGERWFEKEENVLEVFGGVLVLCEMVRWWWYYVMTGHIQIYNNTFEYYTHNTKYRHSELTAAQTQIHL